MATEEMVQYKSCPQQPKRLQALMGHSSIKITMDTYGHLWANPDMDLEIAIKTEQALV